MSERRNPAVAAVVFPGEVREFELRGAAAREARPATIDVSTDPGAPSVPIVLARR